MTFPKTRVIIFFSSIICGSFNLHASESQVEVIEREADLPEPFCRIWEKGDYLLSDGQNLAIIGASSRMLGLSLGNVPEDDTMGSIISPISPTTIKYLTLKKNSPLI